MIRVSAVARTPVALSRSLKRACAVHACTRYLFASDAGDLAQDYSRFKRVRIPFACSAFGSRGLLADRCSFSR
jgi:hypothetical protein